MNWLPKGDGWEMVLATESLPKPVVIILIHKDLPAETHKHIFETYGSCMIVDARKGCIDFSILEMLSEKGAT